MLHHFLIAQEQQVPSTTGAILAAIQRERTSRAEETPQKSQIPLTESILTPLLHLREVPPVPELVSCSPHSLQFRRFFQNFLTLATIAAVILAAVGLFNRFTNHLSPAQKAGTVPHTPAQSGTEIGGAGWDSVVIGLTLLSATGFTAYNFNVVNGQMTLLFASQGSAVTLDAISNDGQSLLYEETLPGQQRSYDTFSPAAHTQAFYQQSSAIAGNAIWMDTEHVLVQDNQGSVLILNVQSGKLEQRWSISADRLTFYHSPFLYFIGAGQPGVDTLYRLDLEQTAAQPQFVAAASPGTRFLLSPDGTTIVYALQGSAATAGIYAVASNGTHLHLLRSGAGLPLGYSQDNALMVLQQVGARLEVIKQGITPQQREQTVFSDAAPRAISLCGTAKMLPVIPLCNQAVVLEPYGRGLLLHAFYANGSHGLVYDDLLTGTSREVMDLDTTASVQLPGWSRIGSGEAAASAPLALCA